jgi:alpha-1,6-mannosyltransferase
VRIVQLANLVHATSGGLRVVMEQLGTGAVAAGHRLVVVTPGARQARRTDADGTLRITLPGTRIPASGGYRLLLDRDHLRTLLTELRPDAIEIHDRFTLPWVASWARRHGIATTVVVHEQLHHVLDTWTPLGVGAARVARAVDARLARAAGPLVVPSRAAAASFPDATTQVVPWGVDLQRFHPGLRRRPVDDGGLRLVVVGRLSREKRPELAIEALRELAGRRRSVRLDVLGDGPLRRSLQRRSAGLPVTFLGHRPAAEVARRLAAADVLLAPCPAESYGLAALEALACGVPIVVPTTGALPELLDLPGGAPTVSPAGATASTTGRAMAFAVEQVLQVPATERRAAARELAERRPWSRAVTAMLRRHGAAYDGGGGGADRPEDGSAAAATPAAMAGAVADRQRRIGAMA